jgi:hypothetical protein
MKVKILRSAPGYGYFRGDIACLPDETARTLIENAFAAESDESPKSDLPEDLPCRSILIKNGINSKELVLKAGEDGIRIFDGIGTSAARKIIKQLKGDD